MLFCREQIHKLTDTNKRWYCHLQNDCENVYVPDIINIKGALAEDLENREFSFPIVTALYSSSAVSEAVKMALKEPESSASSAKYMKTALDALQSREVKDVCLEELELVKAKIGEFGRLWSRRVEVSLEGSMGDV
jgi:geranylgeranyldiphosphate transferase